ncbi:PhzF family phenazine biosynthesis protein [Streptomyces sp. NPDC050988]|uniref:PhzF family phenazine biosynthesis protein n=1 Tax=Streptomyces sp. NPDC050988 TaxID=3365637 RepID=UPI0037A7C785
MRYDLADVFTDAPLTGGNQLAVFADTPSARDGRLMQAIALEMNLSETVFLQPPEAGGDARVRLFSTVTEVDFAGHPLLGTAAVLAQHHDDDALTVRLETNVGPVPVTTQRLSEDRFTAWMDQPLPTISPIPDSQAEDLVDVLGLKRSVLPITLYNAGIPHLYVMAESPDDVRAIEPDFPALGRAAGPGRARINVFALTGATTAVTRMFSPYDRVPEDPACGSAAGPLAAHLVRHQLLTSGTEIVLSQGEAVNRPSTLRAVAQADQDEIGSIRVGGGVCLIGSGRLRLATTDRPYPNSPATHLADE